MSNPRTLASYMAQSLDTRMCPRGKDSCSFYGNADFRERVAKDINSVANASDEELNARLNSKGTTVPVTSNDKNTLTEAQKQRMKDIQESMKANQRAAKSRVGPLRQQKQANESFKKKSGFTVQPKSSNEVTQSPYNRLTGNNTSATNTRIFGVPFTMPGPEVVTESFTLSPKTEKFCVDHWHEILVSISIVVVIIFLSLAVLAFLLIFKSTQKCSACERKQVMSAQPVSPTKSLEGGSRLQGSTELF